MFKLVNGGEHLPQRATRFSAGFDVFSNEDVVIGAGETNVVGIGICLDENQIEELYDKLRGTGFNERLFNGLYLELHPRSSLRAKGLGGGVGIIDMDYRDEIKMVISNLLTYESFNSGKYFKVNKGDKIGQLILNSHYGWLMPSEYTKDEERTGGFGSTS